MEYFEVYGGRVIEGEIELSGAKNAALPILFGSLLSEGKVTLRNVPTMLQDIRVTLRIMRFLGASVNVKGNTVTIDASGLNKSKAPTVLSSRIRSSLLLLSILLSRMGSVEISFPGGCDIGKRKFDLHIEGLKALGARIEVTSCGIVGSLRGRFKGAPVDFYMPTVTGTENIILGATLAKGKTKIMNANTGPEIQDFIAFMNSMGAHINYSSRYIEVNGVSKLHGTEYTIMKGNDEAMTYMIAAGMTGGEVKIKDFNLSTLKVDTQYLREAGMDIFEWGGSVYVSGKKGLRPFDMFTAPYPGVNSDLQPLFTALALMAPGESTITDQVFMERFEYVNELRAFGADIRNYGNSAVIRGGRALHSAHVKATDLRGGTAMVLAALVAKGRSTIGNIYQIDRGYERLEKKFSELGARIARKKRKKD